MDGNGTQRDIGRLEGRLSAMQDDISEIKISIRDISTEQKRQNNTLEQQKGGWKALTIVGGFAGVVGGWLSRHFPS